MKLLKGALLLFFSLIIFQSEAQILKDPTTWTYEVKKKDVTHYQLIFHLNLTAGWHIYSIKPGGDGSLIPPGFVFTANPAVKITGATSEKGKEEHKKFEGVDGVVNLYNNHVDYTQEARVTGKTTIKGKLTYQVCNDQSCLAPKTKEFSFTIQ